MLAATHRQFYPKEDRRKGEQHKPAQTALQRDLSSACSQGM